MLIIELNEFDPIYFKRVAKELHLENIEKIFKLKHVTTFTDEKRNIKVWIHGFNG